MIERLMRALLFRITRDPRKLAEMHAKRGVRMGSECMVYGGVGFGSEPYLVRLGNNVKITAGTQFITHDGGMHVLRQFPELADVDLFGEVIVGNNVFVGVRCIVLPGVSIGDNSVVGAGSIVTRDLPANTVSAGVPCRVIRTLDEYRETALKRGVMTKGLSPQKKREYLLQKFKGSA